MDDPRDAAEGSCAHTTKGALDGIRVLDLTAGVAGPVAGMLLADLGADVVKVCLPPGGPSPAEPGRHMWDRNKRSAVLDPARPAGLQALDQLVAGADLVFVGTSGHGITYEDLCRRGLSPGRPAIWIVMPPYLLGTAPWETNRESGALLFAWLGHAWNQASYDDAPVDCLYPLALHMQGIWAATTAAALVAGRYLGRSVTCLAVVGGAHGGAVVSPGGFAVARGERHLHRPGGPGGALPNYRCYRCSDGGWLFFGAFTTTFIERGLAAVGATRVLEDPRIGGDASKVRLGKNLGWVTRELEQVFEQRPRREWVAALERAGVPVAPVLAPGAWLDHEQVKAMGLRAEIHNDAGQKVVMPGVLVGLSQTPGSLRHAAQTRLPPVTQLRAHWPARRDAPPGPQSTIEMPLGGIRVLDLGTIIAGPYLATLLGELGADVVKVERPPHGDEFRVAHAGRGGAGFAVYNRGQRSLMLDLATQGGRDVFMRLVRPADVVVDNYRPGVRQRLGIDHDRLAAVNPLITSVSVSAFGGVGPFGQRPGFDPVVQALSGTMRAQGGADEANSPTFLTVPVNDVFAAGLGALGVCAALAARSRIGRGQQVSVTLCAASCLLRSEHLVRFPECPPPAAGGRDFAGPGPLSRLYRAADGWVRIDGRWPQDLDPLHRAGLLHGGLPHDDRMPAGAPPAGIFPGAPPAERVIGAIATAVAGLPVAEVLRRLAGASVPAVRARQPRELIGDGQLLEHGLLAVAATDEAGIARVAPGRWFEMPGLPAPPPGPAPAPGEHGEAVLLEAGFAPAEVERLRRTGAVSLPGAGGGPPDISSTVPA